MKLNEIYPDLQNNVKKIIILDKIKPVIVIYKIIPNGEIRETYKKVPIKIYRMKRLLNAKRS